MRITIILDKSWTSPNSYFRELHRSHRGEDLCILYFISLEISMICISTHSMASIMEE